MVGVKISPKLLLKSGEKRLKGDLEEILSLIGESVLTSRWRCLDLWYLDSHDTVRETIMKLSGKELLKFASTITQTIDGRFEAKSEGAAKRPWLVILAVDSSWFEVWSSKQWVIKKIKEHFQDVSDISNKI
jgi:hypothetical protein